MIYSKVDLVIYKADNQDITEELQEEIVDAIVDIVEAADCQCFMIAKTVDDEDE